MDILIVEDDWLIASELARELGLAGFQVVGPAPSLARALRLAETSRPGLALVDVLLGPKPDGLKVAEDFAERGIPVILVTGSSGLVPDDLSGAVGLINKPYRSDDLIDSISFVRKATTVGAARAELPLCLRLAPALQPNASGQYFV